MLYRRLVASRLRAPSRTQFDKEGKVKGKQRREAWRESEDVVHILFDDIAPRFKERPGGYTRIIKLGRRRGHCCARPPRSAPRNFLGWWGASLLHDPTARSCNEG